MSGHEYKIGDRIVFHPVCRWPTRSVSRVVTGIGNFGWPLVRYEGHAEFIVRPSEIRGVFPKVRD